MTLLAPTAAWLRPQKELIASCKPTIIAPRERLFRLNLVCSGSPGMTTSYGWEAITLTPDLALITTDAETFEYYGPEWLPAEITGVVPRDTLFASTALLLRQGGIHEDFPEGWGFFEDDFWEVGADGVPTEEIYRLLLSFHHDAGDKILTMPADELVNFRLEGMRYDYSDL